MKRKPTPMGASFKDYVTQQYLILTTIYSVPYTPCSTLGHTRTKHPVIYIYVEVMRKICVLAQVNCISHMTELIPKNLTLKSAILNNSTFISLPSLALFYFRVWQSGQESNLQLWSP